LGITDLSLFEGRNYDNSGLDYWPFQNTTGTFNKDKIRPAFLGMTQASGACGLPAIAKTFSPASVVAGQTSTLTITLTNGAGAAAGNLNITDHLPAPLVVGGAASTTCTGGTLTAASGSNTVSLTGSTLPVDGCIVTVPVQWPASQPALCRNAAPNNALTNTITAGTDFTTAFGQVNAPATATLACSAEPALPASVPTLSVWMLAALGMLLV
jgi:uncharacterized repeat protein (TIGR01451 family)